MPEYSYEQVDTAEREREKSSVKFTLQDLESEIKKLARDVSDCACDMAGGTEILEHVNTATNLAAIVEKYQQITRAYIYEQTRLAELINARRSV